MRIRHRIRRWKIEAPEAHLARRAIRHLETLSRRCRPCVVAMQFRTLWNGWPTASRMRHMTGASEGRCVLGCHSALDRIELYAVCPVAWKCLSGPQPARMGIPLCFKSLAYFVGVGAGMSETARVQLAKGVYAISRTIHICRSCEGTNPGPVFRLMAKQAR